ncbi:MAG: hypothetical protein A3G39_09930 [Deltaproteobacteria bacterium RIFCSPLOWO2_12_FULL_43_16]|nr:MAG: hypothetical protein A2Z89_02380 [Deltaproteobacteria bacterium GWA2_43_19]OGQ10511.1 MAG: hypothetical protein A3D30_02080 [Deltaproteobacteria bacterium RIFCSPHIGHO2_02_FULL_43_33]OGQ59509.1 MAG: hypothetical protein A3G39_09930 [Deltaproteobacteria bacterium RIFCSPLOWO2_12_FULL_43_16]HBR16560.1 hypothetical protein [Deltaproteobacteria bacterium]
MTSLRLKEYCEAEFENIDTVVSELFFVVRPKKIDYSTAELAAIAAFIHNYYNGIENILKRVLLSRKMAIKDAPTWHKDLLKSSLNKEVITNDLYETLSDYLSFRHFFVHAYSFNIHWKELKPLIDNLEDTLKKFKVAIYHFIDKTH